VLVVVAVAALLVLQEAEFLAVALIIIYAGAILVTYLFVIMLANQSGSPTYDRRAREPFLAILAGFVLMAAVAGKAADLPTHVEEPQTPVSVTSDTGSTPSAPEGNTAAVGRAVMGKYIIALEIAGVLLLISMVGAITLSRKRVPAEGYAAPQKPLGQVGKEVKPF
jgi:NADH-quinone oxidoreductase subunit J